MPDRPAARNDRWDAGPTRFPRVSSAHAPLSAVEIAVATDVILSWAEQSGVLLEPALQREIRDGFGSAANGEDRFEAVAGLLGMLDVVLEYRDSRVPDDDAVRRAEGWIFG